MRLVLWEQLILLIKCLLSTRIDCLKGKIIHHEQGLELYKTLKYKGVGTELAFYPREPLGITECAYQLDYIERLIDRYNRFFK